MARYIIFGLVLALVGAILALNNSSAAVINLPFFIGIKTTVAHILVGSGLVFLFTLIILGIIDYFSRLSFIAEYKDKFLQKEKKLKDQIDEYEWEIGGLKSELNKIKEELSKTKAELSKTKEGGEDRLERSDSFYPK